MSPADFSERYALRTFPEGGIIVDLATGGYSRTNKSATLICAALSTKGSSARTQIGAALGLDDAAVESVIHKVMEALAVTSPRRVRPDPFVYALALDSDGYLLSANGVPKLSVTMGGEIVKPASRGVLEEFLLKDYLRALAPRLAFLQGRAVIHGAACVSRAGAFAICGDSGAGKTTTARAFSSAGAELVAEDMLVVDSTSPLTVKARGERAIHEWVMDMVERLRRDGAAGASDLDAVWRGPSRALQQLWFISAEGRLTDHEHLVHAALDPIDATLTVMASLFLGGTAPADWRRFLDLSATIAEHVAVFQTRVPSGIERLSRAAAAYMRSSTS